MNYGEIETRVNAVALKYRHAHSEAAKRRHRDRLFAELSPVVESLSRRRGPDNHVEDHQQELYLYLLENIHKWQEGDNFMKFFMGFVGNQAKSIGRKLRSMDGEYERFEDLSDDESDSWAQWLQASDHILEDSYEDKVIAAEEERAQEAAFKRVFDKHVASPFRLDIWHKNLFAFEPESLTAIAERHGKTQQAASLHKAKLLRYIEEELHAPA